MRMYARWVVSATAGMLVIGLADALNQRSWVPLFGAVFMGTVVGLGVGSVVRYFSPQPHL